MSLGQTLSGFWHSIQADLFPWLEEEFGPLGGRYRRFVTVLEFARVESFLPHFRSLPGRPVEDRAALARAFIAKAVFDIPTTRALIERLQVDRTLRRLCGWTYAGEIPSEATFSRAFAEFSASALPARLHEALIEKTLGDHLVGHVSRDATAIEARERPAPKPRAEKPKRKRGRPRKGEERPRELRRVERQLKMTLPQMLDDLPKACAVGTKRNAKGHTTSWIGYKLHIDAADGGIPRGGERPGPWRPGGSAPCHRHQSPGQGLQGGTGARGRGAKPHRLRPPGGRALRRTLERRARQCRAEDNAPRVCRSIEVLEGKSGSRQMALFWFVENRLSDGGHALRCNTRSSECSSYVQISNDLRLG